MGQNSVPSTRLPPSIAKARSGGKPPMGGRGTRPTPSPRISHRAQRSDTPAPPRRDRFSAAYDTVGALTAKQEPFSPDDYIVIIGGHQPRRHRLAAEAETKRLKSLALDSQIDILDAVSASYRQTIEHCLREIRAVFDRLDAEESARQAKFTQPVLLE
jgi:hypothetical protein